MDVLSRPETTTDNNDNGVVNDAVAPNDNVGPRSAVSTVLLPTSDILTLTRSSQATNGGNNSNDDNNNDNNTNRPSEASTAAAGGAPGGLSMVSSHSEASSSLQLGSGTDHSYPSRIPQPSPSLFPTESDILGLTEGEEKEFSLMPFQSSPKIM